jgi:hypothetical protein
MGDFTDVRRRQVCAKIAVMKQRTTWQRLHEIAEARREQLGYRQQDLAEEGGPSSAWIRKLPAQIGRPTVKMKSSLEDLDMVLGWPKGTSWRLASDPFEEGSDTAVDEEDRLIHGDASTRVPRKDRLSQREQDLRNFETLVLGVLRSMDEASAKRAMVEIARLLGLE